METDSLVEPEAHAHNVSKYTSLSKHRRDSARYFSIPDTVRKILLLLKQHKTY